MRAIIWMSEALSAALRKHLESWEVVEVHSGEAFVDAPRDTPTVSFVDGATLVQVDEAKPPLGPIIVIADASLPAAVGWLESRTWLSHVIAAPMLQHPMAGAHIRNVTSTLMKADRPRLVDWLGQNVVGRRVKIMHASRRVERIHRMTEFLASKHVDKHRIEVLRQSAEELLANAFYQAPVAAGAVAEPIAPTNDVEFPEDKACDIVYGRTDDDIVMLRVRDPFGALSRLRLVEVLARHAHEVESGRESAPSGLWRLLSIASFVAVSVIDDRHTEVLVGIGAEHPGPRPFAYHLFFRQAGKPVRRWKLLDSNTPGVITDNSITIMVK